MAEKLEVKIEAKSESSSEEVLNEGEKSAKNGENAQSNDVGMSIDEILKMKVALSDGKESLIFSRGPKYSDTLWPIKCHLCRCGSFVKDDLVFAHIKTRKHQYNLSKAPLNAEDFKKPSFHVTRKNSPLNNPIRIFPGEIITEITPDLEDRLVKADEFTLDITPSAEMVKSLALEKVHDYNKKAPVMGLCYVLKMRKSGKRVYFCALCEIEIHGEAYQHFVGSNHQATYVVKHFPKLYEKVLKGLKNVVRPLQRKYVRNIFRSIYRKIEMAKGFRELTVVDYNHFNRYRQGYKQKLRECVNHYDENTINIPEKEVQELIEKSIKGIEIITPDLISLDKPNEGSRDDVRGLQPPQREQKSSRKREPKSISPNRRREGEPFNKSRREEDKKGRFADDPQDWQRYREMIGKVLDDLDKMYKHYEDEPKSHPEYDVEWRKYWRRRSHELERDGIDPRCYDFSKEWIPLWMRRLDQYHAKDIVKQKFEIKRTLRLSYDSRSPSPIRERRERRRPRRRTPTPPPAHNSARYSDRQRDNVREEIVDAPTEPLSVISVMRLLSALEDQLGSLGPKAVQLSSRAVVFEKNNQNANELLFENEVYVFFMTAKEKLKGQLLANIVEPAKIHAANRAVEDLVTILNRFEEHLKRQQSTNKSGNFGSSNPNQNLNRNDQNQIGIDNQYSFENGSSNMNSNSGTGNQRGSGRGSRWQSGALTANQNNNRCNDGDYQSYVNKNKSMSIENDSNFQDTTYSGALAEGTNNYRSNDDNYQSYVKNKKSMHPENNSNFQDMTYSGALAEGKNNYRSNDGNYQSYVKNKKSMNPENNSNFQDTTYGSDNRRKNFNMDLEMFSNIVLQNSNNSGEVQNQMDFRNARSRPMGLGNSSQQNIQSFEQQ